MQRLARLPIQYLPPCCLQHGLASGRVPFGTAHQTWKHIHFRCRQQTVFERRANRDPLVDSILYCEYIDIRMIMKPADRHPTGE